MVAGAVDSLNGHGAFGRQRTNGSMEDAETCCTLCHANGCNVPGQVFVLGIDVYCDVHSKEGILPLICTCNRDLKFVLFLGLQSLLGLRIGPHNNGPMSGSMLFLARFPPRLILLALITAANSSEEYGVATSVGYDTAIGPG